MRTAARSTSPRTTSADFATDALAAGLPPHIIQDFSAMQMGFGPIVGLIGGKPA